MNAEKYIADIFNITNEKDFNTLALEAFYYQKENCSPYKEYLKIIDKIDIEPKNIEDIPFLPIQIFKNREVITSPEKTIDISEYKLFTSSSTTGMNPSKHYVKDLSIYEKSFISGFERIYRELSNYNFFALLPSYLERDGSSLVYMADKIIELVKANGGEGGFYLYNHNELLEKLIEVGKNESNSNKKTILLGVSFALIDFAKFVEDFFKQSYRDKDNNPFNRVIIMETGGMKGRGEELSRTYLHKLLKNAFYPAKIDSEYGMAELLSQAYSTKNGLFTTPPWMKIFIRDLLNPFQIKRLEKQKSISGGINIIDLANIHSCCFIETEDLGKLFSENCFSIEGRIEHSELRGCNMLIE